MYQIPEYFKLQKNIDSDLDELALKLLNKLSVKTYINDGILQLFNIYNKNIEIKKRKVLIAPEVIVPSHLENGYKTLIQNIENGYNLNLYLSTQSKTASCQDYLFNMDNLVHFHLGEKIETRKKKKEARGFIERTGYLLIAKITDENVYFLSIDHHENKEYNENELPENVSLQDMTFYNNKYIKILAKNFPNAVQLIEERDVEEENKDSKESIIQTVISRKKNINQKIVTEDKKRILSNVVDIEGINTKDRVRIWNHKRIINEDIKKIKIYLTKQEDIDFSKQYFLKIMLFKIERNYQIYTVYEEDIKYASIFLTHSIMTIVHYNKEVQNRLNIQKKKGKRLISDLGSLIPIYTI